MRGELTKKREGTFPPSGFWVGGLGEEVGPVVSLVGARDEGDVIWNLGGDRSRKRWGPPGRFVEGERRKTP
jgi:hypothetical protein